MSDEFWQLTEIERLRAERDQERDISRIFMIERDQAAAEVRRLKVDFATAREDWEARATKAVAAEREACAMVVEERALREASRGYLVSAALLRDAASAIRARGHA